MYLCKKEDSINHIFLHYEVAAPIPSDFMDRCGHGAALANCQRLLRLGDWELLSMGLCYGELSPLQSF